MPTHAEHGFVSAVDRWWKRSHARVLTHGPEAGLAPATYAILLPMLIVLGMLLLQAGLVFHARNVVDAAAQQGLQAARGQTASAGSGQAAANSLISQASPDIFSGTPSVSVSRGGATTSVDISAQPASIIPMFSMPTIHAHAQGASEEVTR